MRVVFSERAYIAVLAETTEKIKTETGGLFLGTFKDDTWYVVEAIDPGPKSIFEVAYFEYDQKYTQHLINKIANLYSEKLILIGLWHRHPGSFDKFSSTDDVTNTKYAKLSMNGAVSALVNIDPKFRLTMFHVESPCRYTRIGFEVGDHLVPGHILKLKSPDRFEQLINCIINPMANYDRQEYHRSVSLASFMRLVLPYLNEQKCDQVETNNLLQSQEAREKIVNELVDDISYLSDERGIEFSIQQSDQHISLVQDAFDHPVKLFFMYSIMKECAVLSYEGECFLYKTGMFKAAYEAAVEQKRQVLQTHQINDKAGHIVGTVLKMIGRNRNGEEK